MKKHLLSFALITAIIGSIAAGCSSNKAASGGTDSTVTTTDSSTMSAPASTDSAAAAPADTAMKADTAKKM
jgi:hypothetical protein